MRDAYASGPTEPRSAASIRPRFDSVAQGLEVLASPTRLELLHVLRTPHLLHEIRVQPSRSREDEREDRAITRQAVTRHLDVLLEAGLVRRLPGDGGREGDRYVIHHERLFALVDEMRNLTKLRPLVAFAAEGLATLEGLGVPDPDLPRGPRLLVSYGRDDGMAFGLDGAVGSRWRIGRSPECEIRLDYDPYLSGVHASVDREAGGFTLRDAASRNGTLLNWKRMAPGRAVALAPGDLLTVGRSHLVFQP